MSELQETLRQLVSERLMEGSKESSADIGTYNKNGIPKTGAHETLTLAKHISKHEKAKSVTTQHIMDAKAALLGSPTANPHHIHLAQKMFAGQTSHTGGHEF